jgi:osmoprotectant transport system substrate-binding protein
LLFTTDPALAGDEFVVLRDDRQLQPSEHLVAVVRTDVEDRPEVAGVIDAVSSRLTTSELRALNRRVDEHGVDPRTAASSWLAKVAD